MTERRIALGLTLVMGLCVVGRTGEERAQLPPQDISDKELAEAIQHIKATSLEEVIQGTQVLDKLVKGGRDCQAAAEPLIDVMAKWPNKNLFIPATAILCPEGREQEVLTLLQDALRQKNKHRCWQLMMLASSFRNKTQDLCAVLAPALNDKDDSIASSAISALLRMGEDARPVTQYIAAFQAQGRRGSRNAAIALANLGITTDVHLKHIIETVMDESELDRLAHSLFSKEMAPYLEAGRVDRTISAYIRCAKYKGRWLLPKYKLQAISLFPNGIEIDQHVSKLHELRTGLGGRSGSYYARQALAMLNEAEEAIKEL